VVEMSSDPNADAQINADGKIREAKTSRIFFN